MKNPFFHVLYDLNNSLKLHSRLHSKFSWMCMPSDPYSQTFIVILSTDGNIMNHFLKKLVGLKISCH